MQGFAIFYICKALAIADRHFAATTKIDPNTCLRFPRNGFYKRSNEKSVLPHAIGCQRPSHYWDYQSVLEGKRLIITNIQTIVMSVGNRKVEPT